MLLSWCVDSSLPKAHCGRGWSLLPPLANSAEDRPIWPCAAEGLREGAGKAALGREGAASAVALAHCSRARAREKCGRLKRGVWGALVACSSPSGPEAWRRGVEAHAPGRGMAPFCRHRTIPGCPHAYRRPFARSTPRMMRGAPSRRTVAAAHQARIKPCEAPPVGIRTARNRPETTEWRHTASRRVRLHMPSGPLGARRWRTRPETLWRHFVVTGRLLAVLMPTGLAPQGIILA